MLADFALLAVLAGRDWLPPPENDLVRWLLAAACVFSGGLVLRGLYIDRGSRAIGRSLHRRRRCICQCHLADERVRFDGGVVGEPWPMVDRNRSWLARAHGIADPSRREIQRRPATELLSWFLGWLAVGVPRFAGIVLLSIASSRLYEELERGVESGKETEQLIGGAIFLGALVVGLAFSYVSNRVSLHTMYRDLLSRCFAVRRTEGAVVPVAPPS